MKFFFSFPLKNKIWKHYLKKKKKTDPETCITGKFITQNINKWEISYIIFLLYPFFQDIYPHCNICTSGSVTLCFSCKSKDIHSSFIQQLWQPISGRLSLHLLNHWNAFIKYRSNIIFKWSESSGNLGQLK